MSRPAKKTPEVLEMILDRIQRGDYSRSPLPSTRKLGAELGVSKFTIIRAYREAERQGFLRSEGRRRVITTSGPRRRQPLHLACVVPAVDRVSSFHWFLSIDNVAVERGGSADLIDYRSASDPRLTQALGGKYDVIFLNPPPGRLPPLVDRLLKEQSRLVVPLYADMPESGLWGIDNMPVAAIDLLIYHLAAAGHRKIHLVGGLPWHGRLQQLADRWRERLKAMGIKGEAFAPAREQADISAAAFSATRRLLAAEAKPGAVVFSDLPSAMGGYRALWEAKMQPGRDVDVAALTCEPEAAYLAPSLTCLSVPSRESVIAEAVDQILARRNEQRRNWAEDILPRIRLQQGESSHRAMTPGRPRK
jgi:DNA-binding LacI/PurR family transcriptional regulator